MLPQSWVEDRQGLFPIGASKKFIVNFASLEKKEQTKEQNKHRKQ
jgi:hypothetical protein